MIPDGPPESTASAWDLPPTWTALDAVFPAGGKKSGFAYCFRADEYCRFDWTANKRSPGYPKKSLPEWKTSPPFNVNFDGAIISQPPNFGTKAYLFKTLSPTVDNDTGNPVTVGALKGHPVVAPAYARYTTSQALADPSSYAAFAQEITLHADTRFGDARRHE